MKSKLLICTSLFLVQTLISQNYQTVEEVNDACSQLGFSADEEAEIAVDEIMDVIGLQKNFTIQECPNINNAVAKNIKNSSGYTVRYILYDNDFFNNMDTKAGSDWAAISILAHEIGHHLNGHALNNEGSNHEFELDADYFSGLVLAKMGATLEESQSAINTFRYEKATRTHPAKQDRLNEIERGWTKGNNYKNRTNDTRITEEDADIPEGMEPLVQELYKKARKGDAAAQNNLGYMYKNGTGVEKDYSEAVKWFRKAAEQGNEVGQYNLGDMHLFGYGVEKDDYKGLKWHRKAGEQGWAPSQYRLGLIYQNGKGVEKDDYEAVRWYRKAAEKGYAPSQNQLGVEYQKGNGVKKDYEEAIKWYRKAAEQGNADGQFHLGYNYKKGIGVRKNYKEALKWLLKAAESGNSSAQYAIGGMYYNGEGVAENEAEAISWFKKAARQRLKIAQTTLTKLGETW